MGREFESLQVHFVLPYLIRSSRCSQSAKKDKMHQSTVEAIAREFSGLEVDIATDIETRIAKLLIGCGFLKVESHTLDGAVYETFELTEKNYE